MVSRISDSMRCEITHLTDPRWRMAIVPVFAGTYSLQMRKAISLSGVKSKLLSMPLLGKKARARIISHFWATQFRCDGNDWRRIGAIRVVSSMTGGLPRAMERFLCVLNQFKRDEIASTTTSRLWDLLLKETNDLRAVEDVPATVTERALTVALLSLDHKAKCLTQYRIGEQLSFAESLGCATSHTVTPNKKRTTVGIHYTLSVSSVL